MKIEIDQSIRIEQLNRDTVIGLGGLQLQYAAVVPRKLKRHYKEEFRRRGISRQFAPTIFAAAIAATLEQQGANIAALVIDTEYSSYELLIENVIQSKFPTLQVEFRQIGRSSPAHLVAYAVFRRRRKSDTILKKADLQMVLDTFNKYKKTTGEPHRHVLTQVRQPNRSVKHKYTKRKQYVKK